MEKNLETPQTDDQKDQKQALSDKAIFSLWKEAHCEINNLNAMDSEGQDVEQKLQEDNYKQCVKIMERRTLNERHLINSVMHSAIFKVEKRLNRDDNFMRMCKEGQRRVYNFQVALTSKVTLKLNRLANPKTLGALAKDTILDFVLKTSISQCKEHTRVLQERVVKLREVQAKYLHYQKETEGNLCPSFLEPEICKLEQFICDRNEYCSYQELFKEWYYYYNRCLMMRFKLHQYSWELNRFFLHLSPAEAPVHINTELITELLGKSFFRSPNFTEKDNIWFDNLYKTLLHPAFK